MSIFSKSIKVFPILDKKCYIKKIPEDPAFSTGEEDPFSNATSFKMDQSIEES